MEKWNQLGDHHSQSKIKSLNPFVSLIFPNFVKLNIKKMEIDSDSLLIVYSYLFLQDTKNCALVCHQWRDVFHQHLKMKQSEETIIQWRKMHNIATFLWKDFIVNHKKSDMRFLGIFSRLGLKIYHTSVLEQSFILETYWGTMIQIYYGNIISKDLIDHNIILIDAQTKRDLIFLPVINHEYLVFDFTDAIKSAKVFYRVIRENQINDLRGRSLLVTISGYFIDMNEFHKTFNVFSYFGPSFGTFFNGFFRPFSIESKLKNLKIFHHLRLKQSKVLADAFLIICCPSLSCFLLVNLASKDFSECSTIDYQDLPYPYFDDLEYKKVAFHSDGKILKLVDEEINNCIQIKWNKHSSQWNIRKELINIVKSFDNRKYHFFRCPTSGRKIRF